MKIICKDNGWGRVTKSIIRKIIYTNPEELQFEDLFINKLRNENYGNKTILNAIIKLNGILHKFKDDEYKQRFINFMERDEVKHFILKNIEIRRNYKLNHNLHNNLEVLSMKYYDY